MCIHLYVRVKDINNDWLNVQIQNENVKKKKYNFKTITFCFNVRLIYFF